MVHTVPDSDGTPATAVLGVSQVRRYYELVDAGDVPALVALFAPDARYRRPGYRPMVGHAELKRFYLDQRVIRSGVHTLDTVVAADDEIAVHGLFRGALHDGGRVELRFADFFRMTPQGRISSRDTFFHVPAV
ncbi:nuclear transport factor 2 family protein [Streptomyces jumonjinensis]|uniref:Nuclear transport factor 2 family protein n=1 Tax=Streptomyces jumonjinensis TaxID=1945 RepID=A0A646KKZ9_STRJU|nr:nuclear transport factor 2 family protein [Streptomyces jumonjinensis]MQT01716.1 nuclear transport factor 2 family protein [Streptomyces jumonjinensis]